MTPDLANVHNGSTVTFTTDVFPDIAFQGENQLRKRRRSPTQSDQDVYPLADNPAKLKQNMLLKIRILDGGRLLPVIAKSAMIYKEGKFYVQSENPAGYKQREIKPLRDISEKYSAVEGLKDGDMIAISAMDKEQP